MLNTRFFYFKFDIRRSKHFFKGFVIPVPKFFYNDEKTAKIL